jgi:DNA-binding transcriptional LysR family regulator
VLDPQRLITFETVVRTGTFAAAARELGYTQPGVSQQMRTLERELRATLFERDGRTLRLSEEGELLAERASTLLAGMRATEAQIAAVSRLRAGRVKVCAFPSANAMLIPSAIARFKQQHAGLELELFEAEPPESLAGLESGDYDLVVSFHYAGQDPPDIDGAETVTLLEEPVVLLLPADHPLARRRRIELSELADERWIAGCVRCRQDFVRACEDAGFAPRIDITTDDNLAIQSHVVAGAGLALVPTLTQSFVRHPRLRVRPVLPVRTRFVTATVLARKVRSPVIAHALDALRETAATIGDGSSYP